MPTLDLSVLLLDNFLPEGCVRLHTMHPTQFYSELKGKRPSEMRNNNKGLQHIVWSHRALSPRERDQERLVWQKLYLLFSISFPSDRSWFENKRQLHLHVCSDTPRWCSCWIGWGKVQKEASQDWASSGLWSGNGYRSEEGLHHWLEPSWTGNGDGFELTLTDPATWFKPCISISLLQITTSDLNSGNWWTHLMRKEYFHLFHDF